LNKNAASVVKKNEKKMRILKQDIDQNIKLKHQIKITGQANPKTATLYMQQRGFL
jgi:hypothetical protein